jgi:hypothetical protein
VIPWISNNHTTSLLRLVVYVGVDLCHSRKCGHPFSPSVPASADHISNMIFEVFRRSGSCEIEANVGS